MAELLIAASIKVDAFNGTPFTCTFSDATPDGELLDILLRIAHSWKANDHKQLCQDFHQCMDIAPLMAFQIVLGADWAEGFEADKTKQDIKRALWDLFSASGMPEQRAFHAPLTERHVAERFPEFSANEKAKMASLLTKLDTWFFKTVQRALAASAMHVAHTTTLHWPALVMNQVHAFLTPKKPRQIADLLDGALRRLNEQSRAPFFALVMLNYRHVHGARGKEVHLYEKDSTRATSARNSSPKHHAVPFKRMVAVYGAVERFTAIVREQFCSDDSGTASIVSPKVARAQEKSTLERARFATGGMLRREFLSAVPVAEELMAVRVRSPVPAAFWDEYILMRCQTGPEPLTSSSNAAVKWRDASRVVINLHGGIITAQRVKRKIDEEEAPRDLEDGLTISPDAKRRLLAGEITPE